MVVPIENVLATKDPSILDENEWEEFALSDVKVYQADRKRYASILSASESHPVIAIGKLNVSKEQRSFVLDRRYAASYVIVNDITHFAFGQDENGDIAIWVAGPPGWFSITPNKQYKMVFDASVEAVDLFYFIVDHCKTAKRRKKGSPTVDKLCTEWNKRIGNTFPTTADVAEIFHKHHEFLMKQMNEGAEEVKWHKTPIYAYLSEHHPELARPIESFKKSTTKTKRGPVLKLKNPKIPPEESRGRPLSSPLHSEGDIESGIQTPSERNVRGKVQKSILRPRTSSKGSGKGTNEVVVTEKGAKKRLAVGIANAENEEDDSTSEISETPLRTPTSNAAIDAILDNFSLPVRPKKKSRLGIMSTAKDDTSTPPDVKDTSSNDDDQSVITELPPDTWVCPVENCSKVVYRASSRYSKDVISDHSLSHAHDTKGMLDLVFSEQRRNVNANVSHLVGRIREFAQKDTKTETETKTETKTEEEMETVTAPLEPIKEEVVSASVLDETKTSSSLDPVPLDPEQECNEMLTPVQEATKEEKGEATGEKPQLPAGHEPLDVKETKRKENEEFNLSQSQHEQQPDAKISPSSEQCLL